MPKLTLHSKEIHNANILKVHVGTNCPHGGDRGHGGRTLFRLTDLGSTSMQCRVNGGPLVDASEVEIVLGGDAEHATFIEALEFASGVLRAQSDMFSLETKEEDVN